MAQVNIMEMQAVLPAQNRENAKSDFSEVKAKAGSNAGSFSKQLQRLAQRTSDSKEQQSSNKKTVAERPEANKNSLSAAQNAPKLLAAKPVLVRQKKAEQELATESAVINEGPAIAADIKQDSPAPEASGNMPLTDIPLIIAPEKIRELSRVEDTAQLSEPLNSGNGSLNNVIAELFKEFSQDAVQAVPLQENTMPQEPQEQVNGLEQQVILPEVVLEKQIAAKEEPKSVAIIYEAVANNEVAVNNLEPVVDEAAPLKKVLDSKLPAEIQDSVVDLKPLPDEIIPTQPGMTADNQEKQARVKTDLNTNSEQLIPAAATENGTPAVMAAVPDQSALSGKSTAKRLEPRNALSATMPRGDEAAIDSEVLLSQADAGTKKTLPLIAPEQAEKAKSAGVSDKASQTAATQESTTQQSKSELNFRVAAGLEMEAAKPQNAAAATDVKKLIEFESKRLKSDKSEPMPQKNDVVVKSEKSEGEPNLLLLGKSGLETEKNQLLRSVNTPAAANLAAEPEQVLEQIVKKAEMMVKQNSSEMKIQLQPEFLGKMTIKIVVEEGLLTARFITDSHQVKHMLDSNLNTLRQSLEAQGIRVEKTEVNVQLNNGGMFDGSNGNPQETWQRYQSMNNNNQRNVFGQGYQAGMENDDIMLSSLPEEDYGIASNGSMNFLV